MNLMDGNRKNFSRLSEMIGEPTSKILYITRIPFDARLAQQSNIRTVIIVRQDFDPDAVIILKNIEKKRKKKQRERSPSIGPIDKTPSKTLSNDQNDRIEPHDSQQKAILNTMAAEETDLSSASKITAKDIRDFPVIQRLDELVWDN